MEPTSQTTPSAPGTPNASPSGPAQGPSKKPPIALIAGVVGAVVLIGVIVLVLFLTVFAGPTREDFRKAQASFKDVARDYTSANSDFRGYFSRVSAGSDSADATEVKESFAAYKQKVEDFKKNSGKILKDSEVKQKYDAFIKQNDVFVSFVDGLLSSSDKLEELGEKCSASAAGSISRSDLTKIADSYKEALGPCKAVLGELQSSNSSAIADHAKALLALYDEQQKLFEKLQAAAVANDRSAQTTALSEITKQAREFTRSDSSANKLKEAGDNAEVKDQLNALGEILTDRANGKK